MAIEPPLTKVPPSRGKAHDVGQPADHGVLGVGGQAGLQAAAAVDHRRREGHVGDRRGDRRSPGDEGQVARVIGRHGGGQYDAEQQLDRGLDTDALLA